MRAFPLLLVASCSNVPDAVDAAADAGHDVRDVMVESAVDEPVPASIVTGRVVDSASTPWPGARMQICDTICYTGTAGADGTFKMSIFPTGAYAVDATGAISDGRSASRTVFSHVIAQDIALGNLVVVETGTGQALSAPEDVAIDADLTLQAVDPGALTLPGTLTSAYAAGIRVTPAAFPTYDTQGKTVLAMWALNPFGAKSAKAIAATVKNVFGLSAGVKLAMRAVDDSLGTLLAEVPLTVSTDASTITTDSGGLDRLTWIVLVQ